MVNIRKALKYKLPNKEEIMGAIIPANVRDSWLKEYLITQGLKLLNQGKVRDIYEYPGRSDLLLIVTTDRASIFDFVLPRLVPKKGEVLTALTHFWLTEVLREFPHHLEPSRKNRNLNAVHDLKEEFPRIPLERCLVVLKTEIPPYEMIFRYHLGGSVYRTYCETGLVGGLAVPSGMPKWGKLPHPHFTPSTKAERGHDVNISVSEYLKKMGEAGFKAVQMFMAAYTKAYAYAAERDILILDTKFEGLTMITDEVLTPDSSRYTTETSFDRAIWEGHDPVFLDKQVIRDWGMTVPTPFGIGLNVLKDPEDAEQLDFVSKLMIPDDIVEEASIRYLSLFEMLVGSDLKDYQQSNMGV